MSDEEPTKANSNTSSLGGSNLKPASSLKPASNLKPASGFQPVSNQAVPSVAERFTDVVQKVTDQIKSCNNILIALSKNPNIDEISAALALTFILDKIGKYVTAIYSGETPNIIAFLKPEQTFEKNTNSLQDFIIALNKEKADHLRYKIEGDFVNVYITPYKTTISEKDLEFSQGNFNVDLVISIDVETAESLDVALSEYGRIMHDATAINITVNPAGRFAELEWSDPSRSSVCEMISVLAEKLDYTEYDEATATALLTGIVSATEHFSNARTTPEVLALSSKLMASGADQQLISTSIMQKVESRETTNSEQSTEISSTSPIVEPSQFVVENPQITVDSTQPAIDSTSIPEVPPLIPAPSLAPSSPTAPILNSAPLISPTPPVSSTPSVSLTPDPTAPVSSTPFPQENIVIPPAPVPDIDFSLPTLPPTPITPPSAKDVIPAPSASPVQAPVPVPTISENPIVSSVSPAPVPILPAPTPSIPPTSVPPLTPSQQL